MENNQATALFRQAPVPQAVMKNAIPAMAAMLMVLIYNLADTFFIGQTHDDLQVAAVSLATPVFLIFMSVGTVFGIGGTSVISRAMGEGRQDYARKVCSFCMWACVVIGFAQGVQPLLGYCVGAQLWERFQKVMKFSVWCSFALSAAMTGLCYVFTGQLVSMFLTDPAAYDYAFRFVRILLTTSILFGVFYVLSNALQAMGAATEALIINLSRQGLIYIPMLFILNAAMGINGLVWAQPVADVLSTVLVIWLYSRTVRKLRGRSGMGEAASVRAAEPGTASNS